MSWDSYVDTLINNSGGVITKGAIIGLNGAIWTSAGGDKVLNISAAEAMTLGPLMAKKDASIKDTLAGTGITISGTRYMFLRDLNDDGRVMTAKKAGVGNLVCQSSTQAVLIGFIPEAKADSARSANTTVDGIVKYLEGSGY